MTFFNGGVSSKSFVLFRSQRLLNKYTCVSYAFFFNAILTREIGFSPLPYLSKNLTYHIFHEYFIHLQRLRVVCFIYIIFYPVRVYRVFVHSSHVRVETELLYPVVYPLKWTFPLSLINFRKCDSNTLEP